MNIDEKLNVILYELAVIKKEITQKKDNKSEREEEFVDTQQICEKLKLTKDAVRKYRFKKVIPFYKIRGKVLFKMSEVINSLSYYHNGSNRSQ
ncbi:helix-turn-helix domain-containing protein [Massilibacteroides vaginae]|uniref:helix-turn-helix domain-containing protein n=1 Tax=Massilibacteroides vaginae TaxID=1673718 RepID=UPI000A1CD5A5|nr:helix-turn-helix domain-containing protein [Massilibacteroides vaginae]